MTIAQTTMVRFYSRFIIASAFWTFAEPIVATRAILKILRSFYGPDDLLYLGKLIHEWPRVLYPFSIVLNELVLSYVTSVRRKREMKRLGCYDLIPRVKTRNEANEYCGDIFAEWAEKYGPTFDMNILWAHQHRSMARPFFDRERVVNQSHFERHTGRLKSLLGVLSDKDDSSFDIQVGRYTLDFTMGWFIIINDPNIALTYEHLYVAFLFGLDSRTMVPPHLITKESEKLMFAFDTLRKAASTRIRISGSNWPLFELFSDRMKDSRRTVDAYIMPIVNEAIERNQSIAQGDDDATRTFLEYLVTVSNVRALINETLRVFPPVPFNIRRSKNLPSILPSSLSRAQNGLFLYPRCSITYSLLHIHRRKDIWGDDAEEFKPGRWLAEDPQKVHTTNPFAFIPFNGGPRMCLGQNLAYLLVSHTIVELVRSFTWSLSSHIQQAKPPVNWRGEPGRKGEEQCWPKSSLTLYSDKGVGSTW
ncbi:cytochrome P450 domain-containing protein [Rhizoctonia solani AG-1 IA]|uniref:Cytochrome P450 domain-containing protein n=1 Tax=Thanatephorus cucumeris (strain AG1-IA) TaxID=983506 RepID=L8XA22_THACA|nr:cytochrome P450 domain-containing protein [Rhizoctonia solani AG-1 IA]